VFIILWEYQVSRVKQSEFESIYSSTGAWAELFEKSAGYAGTELLRNEAQPNRYFVIDRWRTKDDYKMFMLRYEDEYKTLSKWHKDLAETESLIGNWDTID